MKKYYMRVIDPTLARQVIAMATALGYISRKEWNQERLAGSKNFNCIYLGRPIQDDRNHSYECPGIELHNHPTNFAPKEFEEIGVYRWISMIEGRPKPTFLKLAAEMSRHRERIGWTQAQVADYCRVSKSTISNIEFGAAFPKERVLIKLCGLYDIQIITKRNKK